LEENATSQDALYAAISCWGGVKKTPENILLTRQKDFSCRLVRQREINEEKDIIELE
jgi:hypothetical protein